MGGPVPTVDVNKELYALWKAIDQYEKDVDARICSAADGTHGYIDSMSYSADTRTLTTKSRTLQVKYDDPAQKSHIEVVAFPETATTSQFTHDPHSGNGISEITNINSKESSDGVRLFVTVKEETAPKEVFFKVVDAKGPKGPKGEDKQAPTDLTIDSSGTSSTLWGANGSKVAEASAAFAKGSATFVSASVTGAAVSASAIALSITIADVGFDGLFYLCKAAGGAAAHNKNCMISAGEYELSAQNIQALLNLIKTETVRDELEVIRNEAVALENLSKIEQVGQ